MNDLALNEKVELTPVGATFLPGIPYQDMEAFVAWTCGLRRASIAALGDALNYAEMEYGETYAQLETVTGLTPGYLANVKYVFGKVPIENRVEGLGMSYLQVVAPLPVEEQRAWLEIAACESLTRDELRELVNGKSPKEETISLNSLAQELIWAWDKGEDIELWLEKIKTHLEMRHSR